MNTRTKINQLTNKGLEAYMSHPVNTKIAESLEDKAIEELTPILMREPTDEEIIDWVTK